MEPFLSESAPRYVELCPALCLLLGSLEGKPCCCCQLTFKKQEGGAACACLPACVRRFKWFLIFGRVHHDSLRFYHLIYSIVLMAQCCPKRTGHAPVTGIGFQSVGLPNRENTHQARFLFWAKTSFLSKVVPGRFMGNN